MPSTAPTAEPTSPATTLAAVPATTAAASPTPAPVTEGWLQVVAAPWADVTIDGRSAGQTPLARIALPAGLHTVMLTHPQYQPYIRRITVEAGQVARLRVDFAQEGVRR
jgi:hypothetical protein